MADDTPSLDNEPLPELSDPRPWPDAIRAQLNRILVQAHFVAAEDQARLLSHLIELSTSSKLGQAQSFVQSEAIARVIFGSDNRDADLISQLQNSYAELRAALLDYYQSRGENDPVIFELTENNIGLVIKASDVQLELADIDLDAERSAILPQNRPTNVHAIVAMFVMTLSSGFYFFGIDRLTTGPTGPESITDVGPAHQKLISIAVAPFTNDRTGRNYFANTIAHELTARLGRESPLRVIASSSMRSFATKTISPAKIAKRVDVRYVITGKILQEDHKIQLMVNLNHADEDKPVWQKSYQHDLKNISSLYGNISTAIIKVLVTDKAQSSGKPKRSRINDTIKTQQNAYVTYLKARSALHQGTPDALAQSITLFRSAINNDPGLPRAHSGLAASLIRLSGYGLERIAPGQSLLSAKKAVVRALRLNELYPEPYADLGEIRTTYERDWRGAERAFVYAIQFNPSYAHARLYYSRFLESQKQHRDAIDQAERAHILDPLSPVTHANRAWQYLQAEWFTRARKHFKQIRNNYPKIWAGSWGLGHYYWRREQPDDALEMFRDAATLAPKNTFVLASLGYAYGQTKKPQMARDILEKMLKLSQSRYVSPVHIAMVHAGLNDRDQAFIWLEKAFSIRARGLAWLNATKEFEILRSDPRYDSLRKRLKLKKFTPKRTIKLQ